MRQQFPANKYPQFAAYLGRAGYAIGLKPDLQLISSFALKPQR